MTKVCRLFPRRTFLQANNSGKSCSGISTMLVPRHPFKSLGPMTAHHNSLPHQPVPPLGITLEKYLKAVRPLVTEDEFRRTQKLVEKFGSVGGLGHKLHSILQERAKKLDNWMGDWWLKMDFLELRFPLIVYSNPSSYWAEETFSNRDEFLRYTARLTAAVVDYKKHVDLHLLTPDKLRGEPLDMNQYFRIFSTCRLPRKNCDELRLYDHEDNPPKHIVVARNNQYFQVEVYDPEGNSLSESVIHSQLQKIMDQADDDAPPVGILTTEQRDTWAEAYDRLIQDDLNKKTVDALERCMFMVCLDRPIKQMNKDNPSADRLHHVLHGGGREYSSGNRWFDKCLQFIVTEDGLVGSNIEHSPAEGFSIVKLTDHVCDYMKREVNWSATGSSLEPKKLEFNLSSENLKDIKVAEENLSKLIDDTDVVLSTYSRFGKDYIRSIGLSPDSFVQMAMTLGLYRLHGLRGVMYQVATMHKFLYGRMEIVHSTSSESVDFCKAMLNPRASLREKVASLRTAVDAHKASVDEAHRGEGLDTILLGLKRAAREIGIDTPELFEDYSFESCYNYRVFSSQLPMRLLSMKTSFGTLADNGYGVPYHIYNDKLQFVASSLHHNPESNSSNYLKSVEVSLDEMEQVLKEAGDMSLSCEF